VLSHSDLYSVFDSDPAGIVEFLAWLGRSSGLQGPTRVADIGAGPGRLLTPMARLGWSVTAYEPNPEFFEAATRVAASSSGQIHVKQGGFEDISEIANFDLVIGVNGPFAYLLTPDARSNGLSAAVRALKPGGLIVLDIPNFDWILAHYCAPVPEERPFPGGRVELRREHLIDREKRVFTTIDHYTVRRPATSPETTSQTHVYAMVSPEELIAALEDSCLVDTRDYGSFESRAPRTSFGARLLLVASKPGRLTSA
jgi:glycine/sarcosine N-methyltransferase